MTKALAARMFGRSEFVFAFTYFARSWRRSDAVLWLQARACKLAVSTPVLLERSSGESAWFRALAFRLFVLGHSYHPLKKKMPVNTALVTNIASKACTTEAVVA